VNRGLISPRGRPPALADLGRGSVAVTAQRVGRVRRRPGVRPAARAGDLGDEGVERRLAAAWQKVGANGGTVA